jgi:hypothetical protein
MAVRLESPQRKKLKEDEQRLKRVHTAFQVARALPGKAFTAEALALMKASRGEGFEERLTNKFDPKSRSTRLR